MDHYTKQMKVCQSTIKISLKLKTKIKQLFYKNYKTQLKIKIIIENNLISILFFVKNFSIPYTY